MTARSLMVLGSMSSAGKSLIATGLCRLYARRGWKVVPFKAQNMSNNAAVCAGGEIGRAQAVQAYAAGVEPSVEMNPVLLKPEADSRSQVILRGQVWQTCSAKDFYTHKDFLWKKVTTSLDILKGRADLIVMEGAGSPAELNLQTHDLVNLAVAGYAQAPCLLVGDIDRGGIFAQLLGTLWLLDKSDRNLIRAFIVNKFRGDADLFTDGVRLLEQRGNIPVLGVVPYIKELAIPDEDAAGITGSVSGKADLLDAAVVHLPHISNFDDFDALRGEPGVGLRFVDDLRQLGHPDVIFLPGTKNTLGDLQWLYTCGLAERIKVLFAEKVPVVGFCGGFQMLGSEVIDEYRLESDIRRMPALGLLPVKTYLGRGKVVTRTRARIMTENGFFKALTGEFVEGYEIHFGQTDCPNPLLEIVSREKDIVSVLDGACSPDGRIWGCHLHGLLDNDYLRQAWLESLGVQPAPHSFSQLRIRAYDHLADVLESSLDIARLDRIIEEGI